MISMNLIRRASAVTSTTVIAGLVTSASACGGATTATGITTNGLEKKAPAEVVHAAVAALKSARSVHLVGTSKKLDVDIRIQHGAATGTIRRASGTQVKVTIIGNVGYMNTDQAGLREFGAPRRVQRHDAGRWLKIPVTGVAGLTLTHVASELTKYKVQLEPKIRQATLNGRKVVVVSYRDGSKLYVANVGPAYPLRGEFKKNENLLEFTEYGALFHITAPSNFIDLSNAG